MEITATYEMIMPVEEVAYAACRRPTQKDQPGTQPERGSKVVKTYSAEWRPFFAMARMHTMMEMRPANVQKMAAVSSHGSHLSPRAETALHSSVMARKMRKTWYVSPGKMLSPSAVSKTPMQATRNRAVPKLTARVMVTLPTTYSQPQIQLATRLHRGGESIKV